MSIPAEVFADVMDRREQFDSAVTTLVQFALKDFDYPTDDARERAEKSLAEALEGAMEDWIEANCDF